ncbi:MAG: hypothetical protein DGJ47_001162 [Rickettsiaceae bacterium]
MKNFDIFVNNIMYIKNNISEVITQKDIKNINILSQEIISDNTIDLEQKIELLTLIDQEVNREIIVELTYQQTDDLKMLQYLNFINIGDLHLQIAKLLPKKIENHERILSCYTDAAILYHYGINIKQGIIDNVIREKLQTIHDNILTLFSRQTFKTEPKTSKYKEFLQELRYDTKEHLQEIKGKKQESSVKEYSDEIEGLFKSIAQRLL